MRIIIPLLALVLFALPSTSSAAALTQQQSTSLIAVVQSSPGTPASAFVSLITTFSNITTTQASSLITVIQAAPSVPANAFVDLLTSFTVDTPTAQAITPVATTQNQTSNIQISSVNVTPTITTAKIEWQTDKPTESKIFLSGGGLSSKIYRSESGISTRHSVFIDALNNNTDYTYEIEAILSSNSVKKIGSFKTPERAVANLIIKSRDSSGSNCGSVYVYAYTEDQAGNYLSGIPVRFINPETKQEITAISAVSNEPNKVAVASFSYVPQAHAHVTNSQTVQIFAGSIEKQQTIFLGTTEFENSPPQGYSSSSQWELVEMTATTYPAAKHVDRLKKKGYTKNTAWFSKSAFSSGGMYRYFDPDTGMCI